MVTEPGSTGLSYGHNVEFAWLMIEAERVLGRSPSWSHFHNHLEHALRYGTDAVRGGTYNRGMTDQPATDTNKVWGPGRDVSGADLRTSESSGRRRLPDALAKLILWCQSKQTDPKSGIWMDTVSAEGAPKATGLAHN